MERERAFFFSMSEGSNDESFVLSDEEGPCSSSESGSALEISSDSEDEDLDYQGPRRGPVIFYKLTYSESSGQHRRRRRRRSPEPQPRKKHSAKDAQQRREKETVRLTRSYVEHMSLGVNALKIDDSKNALHFFERALAIAQMVGTIDTETVLAKIASINIVHHAPPSPPPPALPPSQPEYLEHEEIIPTRVVSPVTPRVRRSPIQLRKPPQDPEPLAAKSFARTAVQIFEQENMNKLIQDATAKGLSVDRLAPDTWSALVNSKFKKLSAATRKIYEDKAAKETAGEQ